MAIIKQELKRYRYTVICDKCPTQPSMVFKAFTPNERAIHYCPQCKAEQIYNDRYPYEGYERPREMIKEKA